MRPEEASQSSGSILQRSAAKVKMKMERVFLQDAEKLAATPPTGFRAAEVHSMEKSSVYIESEQEALRYKWIESEKAGHDLGEVAIRRWVKDHWWGYLRARWLEHLQGRRFWVELDRAFRPVATGIPLRHASPRPHPRSPERRPGKSRHHYLGSGLGPDHGNGGRYPGSPRHQQPPPRPSLRRSVLIAPFPPSSISQT